MKALWTSEWERLWSRRILWLLYIAIPLISWLSARYYASHNAEVPETSPEYTVVGNYPVMGLAEQLMTTFNVFIIMVIVMTSILPSPTTW